MTGAVSGDTPRWSGYTHEQIVELVRTGPGGAASQYAEGQWPAVRFTILMIEARLSRAIADVDSGWQGQAATATTSAVTPLGAWALQSAEEALRTAQALTRQSSDVDHVRRSMPPAVHAALPETPPGNGAGFLAQALADWSVADRERDLQAQRARDLMDEYTDRLMGNAAQIGQWAPPPEVVLDVGPAAGGGGAGPGAGSGLGGPGVPPPGLAAGAPLGPAAVPAGPAPGAVPGAWPGGMPPAPAGPPAAAPGVPTGTSALGAPTPSPLIGSAPAAAPVFTKPGSGGFRPVVPGPPRPDPASAVPLGPCTGGYGLGRPKGGTGSAGGRPGSHGDLSPRGPAGRALSVDGGGARPGAAPAHPPTRSPDRPFRSVGAGGEPATRGAPRPGTGGHPGVLPMGAGTGDAGRTRRRPDYLVEDADAFADDRWFTPPVIGAEPVEDRRD